MTAQHIDFQQRVKQCLMGAIETFVFIRRGPALFENTSNAALFSFIVIPLMFPLTAYTLMLAQNDDPALASIPFAELLIRFYKAHVFGFIVILSTFFVFCKMQGKLAGFCRFVCGMNCLSLVTNMIYVVPIIMVGLGFHSIEEIRLLFLLLSLYEFSAIGFLIMHSLGVVRPLAAFFAIYIYLVQNVCAIFALTP